MKQQIEQGEPINAFVDRVARCRTVDDVFTTDFLVENQQHYSPAYRTALFAFFAETIKKRDSWLESERGIDGGVFDYTIILWNAYEYSPWELTQPMTVVLQNIDIAIDEDDLDRQKKPGVLKVHSHAMLFVAGDLAVPRLEVAGEVHCMGKISTRDIILLPGGYISTDVENDSQL